MPGRIRVRAAALRDPATLARVEPLLAALPAVRSTRGNRAAGSIVVLYDAEAVSVREMSAQLAPCLLDLATVEPSGDRPCRDSINRCVKLASLASLGVSLSFAAAGSKRWHMVSGGVFLGLLGAHLVMNREALLR